LDSTYFNVGVIGASPFFSAATEAPPPIKKSYDYSS
jgi:hypothetical protein